SPALHLRSLYHVQFRNSARGKRKPPRAAFGGQRPARTRAKPGEGRAPIFQASCAWNRELDLLEGDSDGRRIYAAQGVPRVDRRAYRTLHRDAERRRSRSLRSQRAKERRAMPAARTRAGILHRGIHWGAAAVAWARPPFARRGAAGRAGPQRVAVDRRRRALPGQPGGARVRARLVKGPSNRTSPARASAAVHISLRRRSKPTGDLLCVSDESCRVHGIGQTSGRAAHGQLSRSDRRRSQRPRLRGRRRRRARGGALGPLPLARAASRAWTGGPPQGGDAAQLEVEREPGKRADGTRSRQSMRVVDLVHNPEVGGTERLVVDLALALHARGHDVRVVCLRGSGPLATPLEEAGIDVQPLEKSDGPSLRTLLDLNRSLRA